MALSPWGRIASGFQAHLTLIMTRVKQKMQLGRSFVAVCLSITKRQRAAHGTQLFPLFVFSAPERGGAVGLADGWKAFEPNGLGR
jgi:hypothetical protein